MSGVMCHVSRVTCHVSFIICIFLCVTFFFLQISYPNDPQIVTCVRAYWICYHVNMTQIIFWHVSPYVSHKKILPLWPTNSGTSSGNFEMISRLNKLDLCGLFKKSNKVLGQVVISKKHCKNRKRLPREHHIGCQGVRMFLLKDPFKFVFSHNLRFLSYFESLSCHNLIFVTLSFFLNFFLHNLIFVKFEFLSEFDFCPIWVLSQLEFCHNLTF